MAKLFKLDNQIKHYEWGSPDYIPRLMGKAADGSPWAELWMGAHPSSPSRIAPSSAENSLTLDKLIASDPARYLGSATLVATTKVAATKVANGSLPFLFKLLAAEKPLSIQAHPNLTQAREGFERENRAGLALDDPRRNYKDANHKPEIICALPLPQEGFPFTGMCGFREPDEIKRLFDRFFAPSGGKRVREHFVPLLQTLEIPEAAADIRISSAMALRNFLATLFGLSVPARKALTEYILAAADTDNSDCEWELIRTFAGLYPGDPAVIAPLYLNVFRLEPGQAVFLKAGALHAYIHGFGVELMANSDNVLRGGLTGKHVDVPELMKILDFTPQKPQIIKPAADASRFTYPADCEEFSLTVMRGAGEKPGNISYSGPSICIVTQGEVTVDDVTLKQGESAFFPAGDCRVLPGQYTLYIASCGKDSPQQ